MQPKKSCYLNGTSCTQHGTGMMRKTSEGAVLYEALKDRKSYANGRYGKREESMYRMIE